MTRHRMNHRGTLKIKVPRQKETFHPGRKEHAEAYIHALEDSVSKKYAVKVFDCIWWNKGNLPKKPRGITAGRVLEIDAALYGIFATLR